MDKAKKLKPILPTLKEKKRYLVFEVISDAKLDYNKVAEELKRGILEFLGILTVGKAGIQVLNNWNAEKQRGIIRVGHKFVDELKAALLFVKKIDNQDIILKSVIVSGILNKAEKYLE